MIILWIIFWAWTTGWIASYMLQARFKICPEPWDNRDRAVASIIVCMSWIGIFIVFLLMVLRG